VFLAGHRIVVAADEESAAVPVAPKNGSLRPDERRARGWRISEKVRDLVSLEIGDGSNHADPGFEALKKNAPLAIDRVFMINAGIEPFADPLLGEHAHDQKTSQAGYCECGFGEGRK